MKPARKTALLLFALEYIPIAGGVAWAWFSFRLFFPLPTLTGILHIGAFVVGGCVIIVGNYLVGHYVVGRVTGKIFGWIFFDRAQEWARQARDEKEAKFETMQEKRAGK